MVSQYKMVVFDGNDMDAYTELDDDDRLRAIAEAYSLPADDFVARVHQLQLQFCKTIVVDVKRYKQLTADG